MRSIVPAAGIITYRTHADGPRFLLLRNARHGTWGFPKGHREEGEDDKICALRELAEETGLEAPRLVDGFHHVTRYPVTEGGDAVIKEVVYFLGESRNGGLQLSPEHDRGAWMTLDEAVRTLQFDDLKHMVREAATYLSETKT